MDRYISSFLKAVCHQVKYKKLHGDISDELATHIDEAKDEYLENGMTENESVIRAVSQMGNPVEIGKRLNATHRPRTEWSIIALIGMMVMIGGISLLSLANDTGFSYIMSDLINLKTYVIYTSLGISVLLVMYFFDYTKLEKYSVHIFLATAVLFLLGRNFLSYTRYYPYVVIGPIGFEPIMLAMPILVISFSGILLNSINGSKKDHIKTVGLASIAVLISLAYRSLMSTMILGLAFLIMITVGILDRNFKGNRKKSLYCIYGCVVGSMLGFWFLYIAPRDYIRERIFAMLSPGGRDAGWQLLALKKALSGAKLLGKGNGLYYSDGGIRESVIVPVLEPDFVLAYIVSSFGWIAGAILILIVSVAIARMLLTVRKVHSSYGRQVIISVITVFSIQAFINMLMNLGLFPLTKLSLPLVSYGGTSFVVNMGMLGLLLSVYRRKDLMISRTYSKNKA